MVLGLRKYCLFLVAFGADAAAACLTTRLAFGFGFGFAAIAPFFVPWIFDTAFR
jgi:hypothetical protein